MSHHIVFLKLNVFKNCIKQLETNLQQFPAVANNISEMFYTVQYTRYEKTGFRSSSVRCCYISELMLACFRLTMGLATYFRRETIIASFLHLMVLLFNVFFNHVSYAWKKKKKAIRKLRQFKQVHLHFISFLIPLSFKRV